VISYPLATNVGTGTGAALSGMTPVLGGLEGAMRLAVVVSVDAVGATPALSYQVEGSMDGTNWTALALVSMDATVASSSAAVAVPSPAAGVKSVRYIDGLDKRFFKAIRINATANTNVTNWDAELQRVDQ
jgi:hypothetical protein